MTCVAKLTFLQDKKACFSRVGKAPPGDYRVSVSDGQQLQKIRHKLGRSVIILRSISATIDSCDTHCAEIEKANVCTEDPTIGLEMRQLIDHFDYHKSVIGALIESSNGTADLVSIAGKSNT